MRGATPSLMVVLGLMFHILSVDSKATLSDLVQKNIRPIAMTSIPTDKKFLLRNRFSSHIPVHAALPNMQETVYQQVYELPQTLPGQMPMIPQVPDFVNKVQTSKQNTNMILPSNPFPMPFPPPPPPPPPQPPQSQSSPTEIHNNFFIKSSSDMSGVQKAGATGSSDASSSAHSSPVQRQGGLRALLESSGSGITNIPAPGMPGSGGMGIGVGGGGGGGGGTGVSGAFPIGGFGGKLPFPGSASGNGAGNGIVFVGGGAGGGGGGGGGGGQSFTVFGTGSGGGGARGGGGGVIFPANFAGGKRWGQNGGNTLKSAGFMGGKAGQFGSQSGYNPNGFMFGGVAPSGTNLWNIGGGMGRRTPGTGVYYLNNGMYVGLGRDLGYDGWQSYSGRFGTGGHDRFTGGGFGFNRGPFSNNMQRTGFGINNGFRGNGHFTGSGMSGGFPGWSSSSSSTGFTGGASSGFQSGSSSSKQSAGGSQANTGIFNSNNILSNLLTYKALSQMLESGSEKAEGGGNGANAFLMKTLLGGSMGGGFGSGMGGGGGGGGGGGSGGTGSWGSNRGESGSSGSWNSGRGGGSFSRSGGWSFGSRHGFSGGSAGSFPSGGWNASSYSGDNDDDDRR